ncbi:MAG: glycosyltransferase family A protein [Candidatus Staskawiczbacteria bacterium]|nr:glycosyltransferase family A protein [Candidatus Staskawiczbacteria bacterium]
MPLKVSIIMPVYNVEKYIEEAIESILAQSFFNFEFLIFNDGSTDRTLEIIQRFNDPRIKFFDSKENHGYLFHLNQGIKIARGEYILRMDGDDISLPCRIDKQVKFMDKHFEIGAAGSWAITIGARRNIKITTETNPELLRCRLFFSNPLVHPTMIIRTSVLRRYNLLYDPEYYHTEDYKLWLDISRYSELANIPEVLLKYRIHPAQISSVFHSNQCSHAERIAFDLFLSLGVQPISEIIKMHVSLGFGKLDFDLKTIESWFLELQRANKNTRIYPNDPFLRVLSEKWAEICVRKFGFFYWIWKSVFLGCLRDRFSFLHPRYSLRGFLRAIRTYGLSGMFQAKIDKLLCVE